MGTLFRIHVLQNTLVLLLCAYYIRLAIDFQLVSKLELVSIILISSFAILYLFLKKTFFIPISLTLGIIVLQVLNTNSAFDLFLIAWPLPILLIYPWYYFKFLNFNHLTQAIKITFPFILILWWVLILNSNNTLPTHVFSFVLSAVVLSQILGFFLKNTLWIQVLLFFLYAFGAYELWQLAHPETAVIWMVQYIYFISLHSENETSISHHFDFLNSAYLRTMSVVFICFFIISLALSLKGVDIKNDLQSLLFNSNTISLIKP
jgi:hypothetical protein